MRCARPRRKLSARSNNTRCKRNLSYLIKMNERLLRLVGGATVCRSRRRSRGRRRRRWRWRYATRGCCCCWCCFGGGGFPIQAWRRDDDDDATCGSEWRGGGRTIKAGTKKRKDEPAPALGQDLAALPDALPRPVLPGRGPGCGIDAGPLFTAPLQQFAEEHSGAGQRERQHVRNGSQDDAEWQRHSRVALKSKPHQGRPANTHTTPQTYIE